MPELPEVETTLRGIEPHIYGKTITQVIIRQPKLRWPITDDLAEKLIGQPIISCDRRAKYLLLTLPTGVLLIHLGMSGALRILPAQHSDIDQPSKHDHIDWHFSDGLVMRFRDPRRFGAVLWFEGAPEHHPLLNHLGPEPLSDDFNGAYLHSILVKQKRAIKIALMDNAVVVGVGNIYANESLFRSGIAPNTPANRLTADDCEQLVHHIKAVLQRAIDTGGSTLKDFLHSDGSSGYFQQEYTVYGRQGEPCRQCGTPIEKIILGQRSSFYCPQCQPLHAD